MASHISAMLVEMLALREWQLIAHRYEMRGVRTIEEIRHARLLQLVDEFGSIQAVASKIEKSHAQVSQWKNRSIRRNKAGEETGRSTIDSASARLLESKCGKDRGWMDHDPTYDQLPAEVRPVRDRVDFRQVSDDDLELLKDLHALPSSYIAEMRQRAAENRRLFEKMMQERKSAAALADPNVARAAVPVRRGDGNPAQQQLTGLDEQGSD